MPILLTFSILQACPFAIGQTYNYSYGNSRVVTESSNGRSNPSSTYITPGTLSQSAQGIIKYGPQVNPGLPKVNRGAYIGTPGDNMYTMNPILSNQNEPKNTVRPIHRFVYKQQSQKPSNTYIADPNLPLNYANFEAGSSLQSTKNFGNAGSNTIQTTVSKYESH